MTNTYTTKPPFDYVFISYYPDEMIITYTGGE